jgi:hypothetical protein
VDPYTVPDSGRGGPFGRPGEEATGCEGFMSDDPSADDLPGSRWASTRVVLGATLLLFLAPVLADLLVNGPRRTFGYFAADAFYFLTIARNVVDLGSLTFDQAHLTNAFHPLWQFMLTAIYAASRLFGLRETQILVVTVLSNAAFVALGLYWLGRAMSHDDRLSPAFLTLPVGAYAFLVSPMWWSFSGEELSRQNHIEGAQPLYGTLWSYVNGMESSLVIAGFGAIAWAYVRKPILRDRRAAVNFGLLLAVFTFARLDHIFLPGALCAVLASRAWLGRRRKEYAPVAWITLSFTLAIAAYLLLNQLVFSSALPVSGRNKTSFPIPTEQGGLLAIQVALERFQRPGGRWLNLGWRQAQILLPWLVAVLLPLWALRFRRVPGGPAWHLRQPASRFDEFLLLTAPAVVCLALYNFLFVRIFTQGHWYFPVSTLFVSLVAVRVLERSHLLSRLMRLRFAQLAWYAACGAVLILYFLRFQITFDYHDRYARFYFDEAPEVRAHYAARPPKLFSRDDGIVAFATGFPTMNAMGLTVDAEAHRMGPRRLGDIALARGYDHITSLVYYQFGDLSTDSPPEYVRKWVEKWVRNLEEPGKYDFTVDYRARGMSFAIIRADASSDRTDTP